MMITSTVHCTIYHDKAIEEWRIEESYLNVHLYICHYDLGAFYNTADNYWYKKCNKAKFKI